MLDNRIDYIIEPKQKKSETINISLSIIIPTYNPSFNLIKTLDSIKDSIMQPKEIIIVDDHSNFEVKDYVSQYDTICIRLKKNSGPAIARNVGASFATSDIILFIDDDIQIPNDCITNIIHDFNSKKSVAVVGLLSPIHPNKNILSLYKNFYMFFSLQNSPSNFSTLYTSISAIKSSIFHLLKGFDETHNKASVEDVDMGQRIVNSGYEIFLDKRLLAIHNKKYTLISFIRNEFGRSFDLFTMLVKNKFCEHLFTHKRYLNNSSSVLISTILSFGTLFVIALSTFFTPLIYVYIFILLLIWIINRRFIYKFKKYYGIGKTIFIPFILYFDFVLASLGIVCSILYNIRNILKK